MGTVALKGMFGWWEGGMSLWEEWRCALVGSGERSVVTLHPGDHLLP